MEGHLQFRKATIADVPRLAVLNQHLIQDEVHRNRMTIPRLEERMHTWLQGAYEAVLFEREGMPAAYALYRTEADSIYLRHFFVDRQH